MHKKQPQALVSDDKKKNFFEKVHKFLYRKEKKKYADHAATFSNFTFAPESKGCSSQKERIVALVFAPASISRSEENLIIEADFLKAIKFTRSQRLITSR